MVVEGANKYKYNNPLEEFRVDPLVSVAIPLHLIKTMVNQPKLYHSSKISYLKNPPKGMYTVENFV